MLENDFPIMGDNAIFYLAVTSYLQAFVQRKCLDVLVQMYVFLTNEHRVEFSDRNIFMNHHS